MPSSNHKMARDYFMIAMSHHEASHAICALFNYMKIHNIYVISKKQKDGVADYEMADIKDLNLEPELIKIILLFEAQFLYAGMIGEKIYYKEICGSDKFPMSLRIGCSGDIRSAAQIINSNSLALPGNERFLFKKELQAEVKNILTFYWDDVKLVSHELYKHKHLSYEELKYLLTRKSSNKEFWKERYKHIKIIYDDDLDQEHLKKIFVKERLIK